MVVFVGPDEERFLEVDCIFRASCNGWMSGWNRDIVDLTNLTKFQFDNIRDYMTGIAGAYVVTNRCGTEFALLDMSRVCDEIGLTCLRDEIHREMISRKYAMVTPRNGIAWHTSPGSQIVIVSSCLNTSVFATQISTPRITLISTSSGIRPAEYVDWPRSCVFIRSSAGCSVVVFQEGAPVGEVVPGDIVIVSQLQFPNGCSESVHVSSV